MRAAWVADSHAHCTVKLGVEMYECVWQEQYIFVYDALLEALKAGKTVIGCSQFTAEFDKLHAVDPASGKSKLQQQFQVSCTDPVDF